MSTAREIDSRIHGLFGIYRYGKPIIYSHGPIKRSVAHLLKGHAPRVNAERPTHWRYCKVPKGRCLGTLRIIYEEMPSIIPLSG